MVVSKSFMFSALLLLIPLSRPLIVVDASHVIDAAASLLSDEVLDRVIDTDVDGLIQFDEARSSMRDLVVATLTSLGQSLVEHTQRVDTRDRPEERELDAPPLLSWRQVLRLAAAYEEDGEEGDVNANDDLTAPFAFIPHEAFVLKPDMVSPSEPWSTSCFRHNQAEVITWNSSNVVFTINATKPSKPSCSQIYSYYGLPIKNWMHTLPKEGGLRKITYTWHSEKEFELTSKVGLRALYFPTRGVVGTLASLARTVALLSDSAKDWRAAGIEWLQEVSPTFDGFTRRNPKDISNPIMIDADDIPSGTHIAIWHGDGMETLVHWVTGTMTGHHTVTFRDPADGKLYVAESTDVPPGENPYWPPPYGVGRRPWEQWITEAVAANYSVVLLPLKDKYLRKFDDAKAAAFFHRTRGLPYGYHNYLIEWIDADVQNTPWHASSPETFISIFAALERYVKNGTKLGTWSMVLQHVNHVLNSELSNGLNSSFSFGSMDELLEYILLEENRTDIADRFAELVNAPEQDGWVYSNPNASVCTNRTNCNGPSMICEVFVFSMYKAAGLWDDSDLFQATEVDPRSAYLLDIYNTSFVYNEAKYGPRCNEMVKTTGACQVMGLWNLPLPGLSSVSIYPNFANKCEGLPPAYERRPEQC